MLAEAAAKAAEHVALLQVLQPAAATQGSGEDDEEEEREDDAVAKLWSFRTGGTSWFVSLTDARAKTGMGCVVVSENIQVQYLECKLSILPVNSSIAASRVCVPRAFGATSHMR